MSGPGYAVLVRHGHSAWNLTDRFTGWTDIPLTDTGLAEAAQAGRRLAAAGLEVDEAHVSRLRRSRQTAQALLEAAGWGEVPLETTWRLNERHYGALQGMDKAQIFAAWGEEASRRWWRGYLEAPPPLTPEDPRHPRHDPMYGDLDLDCLPASESLRDCQSRLLPYWRDTLLPRLAAGRRLLVVSHGNTLRALVMHLDGLDAQTMEGLEIPAAVPLVYRFGTDLTPRSREWLE